MKDMPEDAAMIQGAIGTANDGEYPTSGHQDVKFGQRTNSKLHLSKENEYSVDLTTRDSTVETSFE